MTTPPIRLTALHPHEGDADLDPATAVEGEQRSAPEDRPWIMTNMIASADGATAVAGLSGGLGGPADFAVFLALRSVADAIVVGAATVREERYRIPGMGDEARQAARAARGQAPRPRIVIVTASLDLDVDLPLFSDPEYRPLVATAASAPADRRARLSEVADIIDVGDERVDLPALTRLLGADGHRVVLAEGGPSLNGQLIADDLVDEWNLSVSALLVGGDSARPAHGRLNTTPPRALRLDRVWLADDLLFCRWIRRSDRA